MVDQAERVRRALGSEYRLWWGRIAQIEAEIGRPSGYLSRIVSGEITPFRRDLSKILAALGIHDTARWMRRRVNPSLDLTVLMSALPRPAHTPSACRLLKTSLRLALTTPQQKRQRQPARAGIETPAETHEAAASDFQSIPRRELPRLFGECNSEGLARAAVSWLELFRYDDPSVAALLARKLTLACGHLPHGALELSVRAGLAWASALRLAGDLIHSGLILLELSPYCWRLGRLIEADYLQRLAPLLRNHLRIPEALAAIDEAQALYIRSHCGVGAARTHVDRAICLFTAARPEKASREARAALELLPKEEERHRSAAFLVLSLCVQESAYLDMAEETLSQTHAYDRLSFAHGRAQLAQDKAEAELYLRRARDLAMGLNPFDAALMTLHLVELLLDRGATQPAATEIRQAYCLLGPFRAHPTACTALLELGRLGGRLTSDSVSKARDAIRKAQVSLPTHPGPNSTR